MNQNSAMLEKAALTKPSCAVAPAGWRASGRVPNPMRLWRRAVPIPVALFLATLWVQVASAQTTLLNGTNVDGTLLANTTNSYTFTANTGDNINLRVGTTNFEAWLQLFGPGGKFLVAGTDDGTTDAYINNYTPDPSAR